MEIYFIALLIFLFATMLLVALISDKAERRIGRNLLALSKFLPLSKIAEVLIKYLESKK